MHVTALKRIERYLLKTSGKGIILSPSSEIAINWQILQDYGIGKIMTMKTVSRA